VLSANPTRSERIGLTLACIGGAGAVLQAFLAWQQSAAPALGYAGSSYDGGQYPEGFLIAWLGVAILILCAGWGMRNSLYDVAGWLLILGILIGIVATVTFVSSEIQLSNDRAELAGVGAVLLDSIGFGLYLAVASGPLTLIGVLLAVRGHRD
jgi:hypothetical protein